jgi:hypothetical protein
VVAGAQAHCCGRGGITLFERHLPPGVFQERCAQLGVGCEPDDCLLRFCALVAIDYERRLALKQKQLAGEIIVRFTVPCVSCAEPCAHRLVTDQLRRAMQPPTEPAVQLPAKRPRVEVQ